MRVLQPKEFHVLVVEDDTFQRLALIDILTLCHYRTTDCANGKMALELLHKEDSDFDLVLLDVMMPEMTGPELLDELRSHDKLKNLPVLMMSSSEEMSLVSSCLQKGARDYLIKPLRVQVVKGISRHVTHVHRNAKASSGGASEYQTIRKLGQGTSGTVLLVQRLSDGRQMALKQVPLGHLSEEEKKSAFNEVQLLKVLVGPSIVRYYDSFIDKDSDTLNIVMEYAEGGTLAEKIAAQKHKKEKFSDESILYWFSQLVLAMLAMDSKNILHRDIKAQNIFLSKDSYVKLGDLGIAKSLSEHTLFAQTACGTPYFMSPEVIRGESYNQKCDVWALGGCLYELATLKKPFDSETLGGLFEKIKSGQYDPLPAGINPDIATLVTAMLTVDPNRRPSIWDVARIAVVRRYIRRFVEATNSMEEVSSLIAFAADNAAVIPEIGLLHPNDNRSRANPAMEQLYHMACAMDKKAPFRTQKFNNRWVNVIYGHHLIRWLEEAYTMGVQEATGVASAMFVIGWLQLASGHTDRFQGTNEYVYKLCLKKKKRSGWFSCCSSEQAVWEPQPKSSGIAPSESIPPWVVSSAWSASQQALAVTEEPLTGSQS